MALILDLETMAKRASISISDTETDDLKSTQDHNEIVYKEYLQFELSTDGKYCVELDHVDRLEEFSLKEISYTGNIPIVRYRDDFMPILDMDFCLGLKDDSSFRQDGTKIKVLVIDSDGKKFGCMVKDIRDIDTSFEEINTVISDRDGIIGTVYLSEVTVSVLDITQICSSFKEIYNKIEFTQAPDKIAA